MPCWANRCIKCIWWKKRGTKGHTNNPAVSALPWSGTPSWDDEIIPSELSPSNLLKVFDWFFLVAFLDRFIVSRESDGAAPRYHQRLQETNTEAQHFFAHMIVKFKNSPKERASGRVQTIALLLYGPEQRGIPIDFKFHITRQDSLLQKSLCLWDHNYQQHHRASARQFCHWTEWPVYLIPTLNWVNY